MCSGQTCFRCGLPSHDFSLVWAVLEEVWSNGYKQNLLTEILHSVWTYIVLTSREWGSDLWNSKTQGVWFLSVHNHHGMKKLGTAGARKKECQQDRDWSWESDVDFSGMLRTLIRAHDFSVGCWACKLLGADPQFPQWYIFSQTPVCGQDYSQKFHWK